MESMRNDLEEVRSQTQNMSIGGVKLPAESMDPAMISSLCKRLHVMQLVTIGTKIQWSAMHRGEKATYRGIVLDRLNDTFKVKITHGDRAKEIAVDLCDIIKVTDVRITGGAGKPKHLHEMTVRNSNSWKTSTKCSICHQPGKVNTRGHEACYLKYLINKKQRNARGRMRKMVAAGEMNDANDAVPEEKQAEVPATESAPTATEQAAGEPEAMEVESS